MFKLAVFFALVAAAFGAPQFAGLYSPYAYSGLGYGAPLASHLASPLAYSNIVSSPISYSVPAPYAYSTGNVVSYAAEPVEQHGYKIAY